MKIQNYTRDDIQRIFEQNLNRKLSNQEVERIYHTYRTYELQTALDKEKGKGGNDFLSLVSGCASKKQVGSDTVVGAATGVVVGGAIGFVMGMGVGSAMTTAIGAEVGGWAGAATANAMSIGSCAWGKSETKKNLENFTNKLNKFHEGNWFGE